MIAFLSRAVRDLLDKYSGEISRQLQGTKIGEVGADRDIAVLDYPLLPVRRRFWEECFRQIDAEGTRSQLRSQLRILRDAIEKVADCDMGALIAADELYEALAGEMITSGVLLHEIRDKIARVDDGTPEGKLARRICGLVFLIGRLRHEPGADIGVRATKEHIADLLVDDLNADNGKLRNAVEGSLSILEATGALMRLGNEFRLQTKEGAEWDREFRNRQSKISNNDPDLQIRRDGLLCAEADAIVRSLKITQGTGKEPRPLIIHREPTPPVVNGDGLPVWIRDGWSASEKEFVDEARRAGADSPTIYVFIPKQSPDQLRGFISDADAAQQTIDFKGVPNGQEGIEAQQSMASRRDLAVQQRDTLVKQIVANAKVFQGGGSELLRVTLDDRLREATEASLVRMFPRFKEADAPSSAWEAVIKRARAGADQAFQPVGHSGPAEQHSVCKQVLDTIGAGRLGIEIRKALKASPYGWPQDAIDAALIELHRSQHISAVLNGSPVQVGQLDQNRISKAEFRVERTTLSVQDRLALRRLFGLVKVQATSNNLGEKAPEFLSALMGLANSAGGQPPLPAAPATAEIDDLKRLIGNEQLAAIRTGAEKFEKKIGDWTKLKEIADKRKPTWDVVERLARHAAGVPAAVDSLEQVEAIRNGRMLLESSDPATPVRAALAGALRQAASQAHAAHEKAYQDSTALLASNSTWQRLSETDRQKILVDVGLVTPAKLDVSSDEALLSSMDQSPLAARQAQGDAVAGRVQRALELAAKLLEPKVRRISVESATLGDADAVRAWVARQETTLLDAVKQGPIFVG